MTNNNYGKYLEPIKAELADFRNRGIKPTFRAMFYTLVDSYGLPNDQKIYKYLNRASVTWRENGSLPLDCFVDHTRRILKNFNDVYETPDEYVDRGIYFLENASSTYKIPRWHNQPYYVEIWIEKNAPGAVIQSIVDSQNLQVVVVPNGGNSSLSYTTENIKLLKRKLKEGKQEAIVLYFGDFDPSGLMMHGTYRRRFEKQGIEVDFRHMAITEAHIKRFKFPTNPNPITMRKLLKDKNSPAFKAKYGKLFAVELEAMMTPQVRQYFKDLIVNSVDNFFDPKIYQEELKLHPASHVQDAVVKKVGELNKRL